MVMRKQATISTIFCSKRFGVNRQIPKRVSIEFAAGTGDAAVDELAALRLSRSKFSLSGFGENAARQLRLLDRSLL